MNNIRIGTRLGTAFAFILLLLVIVAFTGFSRIQSLGETADTLMSIKNDGHYFCEPEACRTGCLNGGTGGNGDG